MGFAFHLVPLLGGAEGRWWNVPWAMTVTFLIGPATWLVVASSVSWFLYRIAMARKYR